MVGASERRTLITVATTLSLLLLYFQLEIINASSACFQYALPKRSPAKTKPVLFHCPIIDGKRISSVGAMASQQNRHRHSICLSLKRKTQLNVSTTNPDDRGMNRKKYRSGISGNSSNNNIFGHLSEQFQRFYFLFARRFYHVKKFIRQKITQKFTIYILQCKEGKYYVGSTSHRRQRMKQHFSARGGSKWTRMYPPVKVIKEYKRVPQMYYLGLEAKVTAELMMKHGVNNVRGAMFARPGMYTTDDVDALTGFLGHYNDLIYKEIYQELLKMLPSSPSQSYHFTPSTLMPYQKRQNQMRQQERYQQNKENGTCFKCGQRGHFARNCPIEGRCYSCGQIGHFAADCPNDRS